MAQKTRMFHASPQVQEKVDDSEVTKTVIARRAGVVRGTLNNFLNGKGCSQEIAEKLYEAMRALGVFSGPRSEFVANTEAAAFTTKCHPQNPIDRYLSETAAEHSIYCPPFMSTVSSNRSTIEMYVDPDLRMINIAPAPPPGNRTPQTPADKPRSYAVKITDVITASSEPLRAAAPIDGRSLLLGPSGSGKTMLLRTTAVRLANALPGNRPVPVYLHCKYLESRLQKASALSDLVAQALGNPLSQKFGQQVVLLVDGLDRLCKADRIRMCQLLVEPPVQYDRIIVTCQCGALFDHVQAILREKYSIYLLLELSHEKRVELTRKMGEYFGRPEEDLKRAENIFVRLGRWVGNPQRLATVCQYLFDTDEGIREERLNSISVSDVLSKMIDNDIKRSCNQYGRITNPFELRAALEFLAYNTEVPPVGPNGTEYRLLPCDTYTIQQALSRLMPEGGIDSLLECISFTGLLKQEDGQLDFAHEIIQTHLASDAKIHRNTAPWRPAES
ncbi:MAG: NACHT domain-containing protein [Planctomycetales bacterium]|nr:NACHT domain-containing protein [Planctomycetales bacterium]